MSWVSSANVRHLCSAELSGNIMTIILNLMNIVVFAMLGSESWRDTSVIVTLLKHHASHHDLRLHATYQGFTKMPTFLVLVFLAVKIATGVITAIPIIHISKGKLHSWMKDFGASGSSTSSAEVLILFGTYQTDNYYPWGGWSISVFYDFDAHNCMGGPHTVSQLGFLSKTLS